MRTARGFMTNIAAPDRVYIEQAATNTGLLVYIGDPQGVVYPGDLGVWSGESNSVDHGAFWIEFERLRNEGRNAK